MSEFFDHDVADYTTDVQVGYARAGVSGWLVAAGWLVFPFAVATVLNPIDAVKLQNVLRGLPKVQFLTPLQQSSALVAALSVVAALMIFQLVMSMIFYARARIQEGGPVATPPLWPLAAISAGVVGNALWYFGLGYVDPPGIVVGLSSAALTLLIEIFCNSLARKVAFVGA